MGTYRGAGGSSDSTTTAMLADVTAQAFIATTKASEAYAFSASAADSLTVFRRSFLGASASAPTTDNDGNALTTSAHYLNTVAGSMFYWSGSAWVSVPQGAQGVQGIQGVVGATGDAGADGSDGTAGIDGTDGARGIQGSQGLQGNTGSQGATGSKGDQGDQGAQGIQGATGSQGETGSQGSQGDTGAQGIQGLTGATGGQGEQGDQGDQGIQGVQGVQGADGDTGSQGIQGIQGLTGSVSHSWIDYAAGATSQVLTVTIATGDVYTYTYGTDTLYRLVPSGSEPDAFYNVFSGGVLSGLVVTKGITI